MGEAGRAKQIVQWRQCSRQLDQFAIMFVWRKCSDGGNLYQIQVDRNSVLQPFTHLAMKTLSLQKRYVSGLIIEQATVYVFDE